MTGPAEGISNLRWSDFLHQTRPGESVRCSPIQEDPENRTPTDQGRAICRDVDQATHEHGLATPGGTFSPTGVGGLTLGGGIAWLMRQYGLACDNLLRAEVVTASGEVIHASETENPDLFWALRGGCGNFGVVTDFEFRLHPVHTVFGGLIVHPVEHAREALQFYREFNLSAPDELTTFAGFMTTPEGHEVVAFVTCYSGDPERGEEVSPVV
jgi:FAD/FMN-containing dehydrogenase